MQRRTFLRASAGLGAAVVVGRYFRGTSWAAPFGEAPGRAASVMLPEARRARRVLEVFLYGGMSPWETLYFVRNYGRPGDPQYANQQYYAFDGSGADSNAAASAACGLPGGQLGQFFARDAAGADVELGPFAQRLWPRTDLIDRMRIVVQQHRLEPHEAAVPQALTGRPVGQPAAAGLGSHIQRFFLDRDPDGSRASPWSYLFATGGISGDNVSAAAATGLHPGSARPLAIKLDNAVTFSRLLDRTTVTPAGAPAYDALTKVYLDQYGQRLTWTDAAGATKVRSPRYADTSIAAGTVENYQALKQVLTPELFDARPGTACGASTSLDLPGMSLEAARVLLTHPTEPARYVCVSDVGLREASGGGGYDTHDRNARDTARNFDNLLRSLTAIINGPGETDPRKLSLDDTLIILNTEFGRTPLPQEGGSGRNHHPYGYVTAFLGATITAAERGVYGAIGPDGRATAAATPAENRIAGLLSMGIWPFSPEAFAVSDVTDATSEEDAAQKATARVLGVVL